MSLNRMAIPLLLLGTMARAQQAAPDDRQVTQQLMQQVKDLQERVLKLESQRCVAGPPDIGTTSETLKPSPVAPPTTPPPGSPPQETAGEAQSPSFLQDMHNLHGLKWRGFGELDYQAYDRKASGLGEGGFVPGSAGNFYLDDFDLLMTADISDKASFLSEVIFGEETPRASTSNCSGCFLNTTLTVISRHRLADITRESATTTLLSWAVPGRKLWPTGL